MPPGTTDLQGSSHKLLLTESAPHTVPALNSSPADHLLIFTIATTAYPPQTRKHEITSLLKPHGTWRSWGWSPA